MKTSSGLLLGVLFTLVVVIVAVVIYFNTRPEEEKPGTSTGPSSPTLPSIGDLTIAQTLSPNSDSETYTIEPYTIEYADGDNEKSLSKNVTFTLNWENKDGFDTVSRIRVEHYIRGIDDVLQTVEVNDNQKLDGFWDYAPISVKISGLPDDNTAQYSFVGQNMFKIIATYGGNIELPLYDGTGELGQGETHPPELVIKPEDLTATIDMTGGKTVVYSVSLLGDTRETFKNIDNTSYTFTATSAEDDTTGQRTSVSIEGIELIAQDTEEEREANGSKKFKFRYKDDGKYVGAKRTNIAGTSDWFLELAKVDDDLNNEDDMAVIITFSNSYLDKSGDTPPGDTYRMLKITAKTCRTDPAGCLVATDKTTTEDLFLYGSHHRLYETGVVEGEFEAPKPAKWLGLTGRTKEESPMKHWKIEETII
jgi:hypothetical protein